jgi:hypothetical protein
MVNRGRNMEFIKKLLIVMVSTFIVTSVASAQKAPLPYNKKLPSTIKHIANHGNYIVVNLSKAVDNTANCIGPDLGGDFPDSTETGQILSFFLDITTVEGKSLFANILTAASLKRKIAFKVSTCDLTTNLPIIDSMEMLL